LLEELSLTKLYSTSALITPMTIDAIFDSKVSYNDFDVAVRSNLEMYDVILEVAYDKYRHGAFSDNGKMNLFRELSKNDNLFR